MYEYFANGSFEGDFDEDILGVFFERKGELHDSTNFAFAGSKSGQITIEPGYSSTLFTFPFYGHKASRQPTGIDPQKLYDIKCHVYIPSGSKILSADSGLIAIGSVNYFAFFPSWDESFDSLTKIKTYTTADNEIKGVLQEGCIDQWVEISSRIRFVEDTQSGGYKPINLMLLGTEFNDIGGSGAVILDTGEIYIDSISVEESTSVDDCGLTIPSPQYEVQDDTGTGNGSITINVSKPGSTLEYKFESSAENRPYQSSPQFLNLQGLRTYDVTVRVDGSCEYLIPNVLVELSEAQEPTQLRVTELPNRHQKNVQCRFREYNPIFYPGEKYRNMVNSEDLLDDVADVINDLKLSLLDSRGNIASEDIATFQLYDEDGNGNARLAYEIPVFPSLKNGLYRIVIYEEVSNKLYLVSNQHRVSNNKNFIINETALFEFYHTTEIYNYGYDELTEFVTRLRLQINAVDYTYPFDAKEYEEVSTGESQNQRFDVDSVVEIETELFDEKAHRAFAAFLAHNNKVINHKFYAIQKGSGYEQDRDKNSYLWNGSIRLIERDFSTINKQ